VDPAQGGQFDVLDGAPWARPGGAADVFGLVVAVARLDQWAISRASHTISVRMWLATRQPTIIRENTSMMKHVGDPGAERRLAARHTATERRQRFEWAGSCR